MRRPSDWLTSPLFRRAGYALRSSNPTLYARLNDVRRRVLLGGRDLDAYQHVALSSFGRIARVRGARVIELGSDPGMRVLRALGKMGAREILGVNPAAPASLGVAPPEGPRILAADACALPFDDASVDHVFSVAVLEHILDLERALAEARRVLRPGGIFFASFGPIWSGGKGHHVNATAGDLRAWHGRADLNPLPDFAHLLLDREELREALVGRTDPRLVEPIVTYVFDSTAINRLFYSQYLELFARAGMRVRAMTAERDPVSAQLARLLRFRHPHEKDFDVTNALVVLER